MNERFLLAFVSGEYNEISFLVVTHRKGYQARTCNREKSDDEKKFAYRLSTSFSNLPGIRHECFSVLRFSCSKSFRLRASFVPSMRSLEFLWISPSVRDTSHFSRTKHGFWEKSRQESALDQKAVIDFKYI